MNVTKTVLKSLYDHGDPYEIQLASAKDLKLLYIATPFKEHPGEFRIIRQERNGEQTTTLCYNIDEAIREFNWSAGY